jgi:hypothetical protein
MDILNDFGIDPYAFLGVKIDCTKKEAKEAYKKKALVLHPDKSKTKKDAEFKLLCISYKYVIENCVEKEISTFENLKNSEREEQVYYKNFYDIDFDDMKTRKDLFQDDGIDFSQFKSELKRFQGGSTSYVAEDYYKKEVVDLMKTNGKFDKDKFNAYFSKLKKSGKIENQLIKKEKVVAFNDKDNYVKVNIHGDKMLNYIEHEKLEEKKVLSNNDILDLSLLKTKELENLVKENKKNTGKISKKKIKELEQKAKASIQVPVGMSFKQAEIEMIKNQEKEIQESKLQQKEYIEKNKHRFIKSISYRQ